MSGGGRPGHCDLLQHNWYTEIGSSQPHHVFPREPAVVEFGSKVKGE